MSAQSQYAADIYNQEEAGNPLYLIQGEIAILKKLDHENVAQLIEVLDDPDGDSLYMVLEMCGKGVIMKVGLDEVAEPYPEEKCRLWFRDMILGIEYCEIPSTPPELSKVYSLTCLQCIHKGLCTVI